MTSFIKRLLPLSMLLIVVLSGTETSAAVKGEKNVGLQLGYTTYNESAVAGIGFSYAFSNHFRVAPNLQYAFRNNNRDGLLLNFDFHVPLNIESGNKFEVYPIVGLNYSCWTNYHKEQEREKSSDDFTTRKNRFGLNAGAGVGYNVTETLRLNFDARYTLVKSYNTATFALGIAYRF